MNNLLLQDHQSEYLHIVSPPAEYTTYQNDKVLYQRIVDNKKERNISSHNHMDDYLDMNLSIIRNQRNDTLHIDYHIE